MIETTEKYIDLVATGLSEKTKIKVVSDHGWRVNVRKKVLHYDPADLKRLPFLVVKGVLLHEIGHLKYTALCPRTKIEKKYPAIHSTYNSFEDLRIEQKLTGEYGDFAFEVLSAGDEFCAQNALATADITRLPRAEQFNALVCLFGLLKSNRIESFYDDIHDLIYYGRDSLLLDPEVKKRFKDNLETIQEAIYDCVNAGNIRRVKAIVDQKIFPLIEDFLKECPKGKKGQSAISVGGAKGLAKTKLVGEKPGGRRAGRDRAVALTELEVHALIDPYSNTLAERLKDILKEKKARRWRGNHYSGRLLNKNAYKVVVKEGKIFSKRVSPDTPDYAFHLLMDCSGSMLEDEKALNTFVGACLIKKVAEILNFEANFFAFDERFHHLKKLEDYKEICGGGTDDRKALKALAKEISPENDNLIFVLTDGYSGGDVRPLIAKLIRKNSTLIGIGFGEHSRGLAERYPDHILIDKPHKLFFELIDKLRTLIKR